jgi:tetratricopeptide (TPR) repeat protein
MRRRLIALLVLLASTGLATAQVAAAQDVRIGEDSPPAAGPPVDKDKLRAAITLPHMSFYFHWNSTDVETLNPDGTKMDFTRKAAELRKRLDGSDSDAQVHLKLVRCYVRLRDLPEMVKAARKAEELLRPLAEKEAAAGTVLAAYCEAVRMGRPDKKRECERLARQATERSPEDWRAWDRLATAHLELFFCAAVGSDAYMLPNGSWEDKLADVARRRPSAAALADAEKRLHEARLCRDHIRKLCEHDVDAFLACIQYDTALHWETLMLKALRGQPAAGSFEPDSDVFRDMLALPEAFPENMGFQVQAATLVAQQVKKEAMAAGLHRLPPPARARLDKYIDRLTRGSKNTNVEAAAFCQRQIAGIHAQISEGEEALEHARLALALDKNLPDMWELRAIFLDERGRPEESLTVGRQWLKRFPSPRSHVWVAQLLARAGRWQEAEKVLRDAGQKYPNDMLCTVALAAVQFHRSQDAEALSEANRLIGQALLQVSPATPAELQVDLFMLRLVYEGLNDRPNNARQMLRNALDREPGLAMPLQKLREVFGV